MARPILAVAALAAMLAACLPAIGPARAAAPSVSLQPVSLDPVARGDDGAAAPDDGELSAFVTAFLRLVGVQHGYMMRLRGENDPDRVDQIKQNAISDMRSAVEQNGLTIDRYNQIALSVRDDPGVRRRVEGLLQQMAADPSGEPSAEDAE